MVPYEMREKLVICLLVTLIKTHFLESYKTNHIRNKFSKTDFRILSFLIVELHSKFSPHYDIVNTHLSVSLCYRNLYYYFVLK
jgi:hypothetical protein